MSRKNVLPLAMLLAVFVFPVSSMAQPQPITQQDIDNIQSSKQYQTFHQIKNQQVDFSQGHRFDFTQQGFTSFVVPIIGNMPNKVAFFGQSADSAELQMFILELVPTGKISTNPDFRINISNAEGITGASLEFKNQRLAATHITQEVKNTSGAGSAHPEGVSGWAAISRMVYCLIVNGVENSGFICARCIAGMIEYAATEGAAGTDQMSLYCPICSNSFQGTFAFCSLWAQR